MHDGPRTRRQRPAGVDAPDKERRPHTGHDADHRGQCGEKRQNGRARQARSREARDIERRGRNQPAHRERGDQERAGHAGEGQQQPFQDGTNHETAARGAERQMNCQRTIRERGPEHLKPRHAAAREQHHQQRAPEHGPQHRARRALHVGINRRCHGAGDRTRRVPARLAPHNRAELLRELIGADTVAQAAKAVEDPEVGKEGIPLLSGLPREPAKTRRGRQPELCPARKVELRRHDADDFERTHRRVDTLAHSHERAHHPGVGAELLSPEPVADDRDARLTGRLIASGERATHRGRHAGDVEERGRRGDVRHTGARVTLHQRQRPADGAEHAERIERARALLPGVRLAVRDLDDRSTAGVVALPQHDGTRGRTHGTRPQHDSLDDGIDGGGDADRDGEQRNGHQRGAPAVPQRSERVPQVVELRAHCGHRWIDTTRQETAAALLATQRH